MDASLDRQSFMKTIASILLCGAALLLVGCRSGISRTGYKAPDPQAMNNASRRPIAIQCNAIYNPDDVEVLGGIHAYDTGFSTYCDEAYVLDTFYKDANALGADIINITEEKQPDFWSTCYRAKAQFLRLKDRDKAKTLVSDAKYAPELIVERSAAARKRTRAIIVASVFGGALGGLIYATMAPHDHPEKSAPSPNSAVLKNDSATP